MHPFDGLLCGREVIYAVGLMEFVLGVFSGLVWLSLPTLLDKGGAITSFAIRSSNEDWFSFACDENILFLVYSHTIFGEDGNGAGIRSFSDTHERVWKVVKCVRLSCFVIEMGNW